MVFAGHLNGFEINWIAARMDGASSEQLSARIVHIRNQRARIVRPAHRPASVRNHELEPHSRREWTAMNKNEPAKNPNEQE